MRTLPLCLALALPTLALAAPPLIHVQTDKPSYRLGETVWFRVHRGDGDRGQLRVLLLGPRGEEVARERVRGPRPYGELWIDPAWPGGGYELRTELEDGTLVDRQPLEVFDVVARPLQVAVRVLRDVSFPGEEVVATARFQALDGTPLAGERVRYRAAFGPLVDSGWAGPTDAEGRCVVRFRVPDLARVSGSLSVGVERGEVRAAAAAPVAVSASVGAVELVAEGGGWLPGATRLGVLARDLDGRPTACEGRILDPTGACLAPFTTDVRGLGLATIELAAPTQQACEIVIDRPAGVATRFPLRVPGEHRVALRVARGERGPVAYLRALEPTRVSLSLVGDGFSQAVDVPAAPKEVAVHLPRDGARRVAQLRVTDREGAFLLQTPVALGDADPVQVELLALEGPATPGELAAATVRVTCDGQPVTAELAASVFHSGAAEGASPWASDLALRARFQRHLHAPVFDVRGLDDPDAIDALLIVQGGFLAQAWNDDRPAPRVVTPLPTRPAPVLPEAGTQAEPSALDRLLARAPFTRPTLPRRDEPARVERQAPLDARLRTPGLDAQRRKPPQEETVPWSVVDTRDTLAWTPRLTTNRKGIATLRFRMGHEPTQLVLALQGLPGGHGLTRALPLEPRRSFHTQVALPDHVHVGDRLELYATVTGHERLTVTLTPPPGVKALARTQVEVDPRRSAATHKFLFEVEAAHVGGAFEVLTVGERLREVQRSPLVIREPAVEIEQAVSGWGDPTQPVSFSVPREARPGSTRARGRVTRWPVVAAAVDGVGSLLRAPYGCFEQTTSTNYPNLVVLSCLIEHGDDAALLEEAHRLADAGFERLRMFEHASGGFQLFPGADEPTPEYTAMGIVQLAHYGRVFQGRGAARLQKALDWLDAEQVDGFPAVFAALAVTEADLPWEGAERGLRYEPQTQYERAVQANLIAAWRDSTRPWPQDLPAAEVMLQTLLAPLQAGRDEQGLIPSEGHGLMMSWQHALEIETTAFAGVAFAAAGAGVDAAGVAQTLSAQRLPNGGWRTTQSTAQAVRALTALVEPPAPAADPLLVALHIGDVRAAEAVLLPTRDRPLPLERPLADDAGRVALRLQIEGAGPEERLDYQLGLRYLIDQPRDHPEAPYAIETRLPNVQTHQGHELDLRVTLRQLGRPVDGQVVAVVPLPGGTRLAPARLLDSEGRIPGTSHHVVRDGVVELYFTAPPPTTTVTLPLDAEVVGVYGTAPATVYPFYCPERASYAPGLRLKVLTPLDLEEAAAALGIGGQATQAGQATPPGGALLPR